MSTSELKILVVGRNGQISRDLQTLLPSIGSVDCVGRPEVDLTQPDNVRQAIRDRRPDVLINAAAYTAVDQAESEPEQAMKINAEAPAIMAEEAKRLGSLFISYSSDYVFDGQKAGPYTEEDEPNPLSVYGASKLAGDRAIQAIDGSHLIFRTSWVYSVNGKNFLKTILKLATERDELRIVDDQIGAPTWSRDIASATVQVIRSLVQEQEVAGSKNGQWVEVLDTKRGLYNLTSSGNVSWYGFAGTITNQVKRMGRESQKVARISAIPTREYPTTARRPLNSRLSNQKIKKAFGISLPPWEESMLRTLETMFSANKFQQQQPPLRTKG